MKSSTRTLSAYIIVKGNEALPAVRSVPLPNGKNTPSGRFIGFYGSQGTLLMFKELRRSAIGDFIRRVDIKAEVGDAKNPMVTLERLPQSQTMHLDMLSTDLQQYIRVLLKTPEQISISQAISYEPELLNVLWADQALAHMKIICWQQPTKENPNLQFGAIAAPEIITSIEIQNYSVSAQIQLAFS